MTQVKTAEAVTPWHPDKLCDQISDAIVDACIAQDPKSRVAVETVGGHGLLVLVGEVTTKADVNFSKVAKDYYKQMTREDADMVVSNIKKQSLDISQGVDCGGAGDQGIMYGYATRETMDYMPQELYFARRILEPFECDGKSQVTMSNGLIKKVVLSVQGEEQEDLLHYLGNLLITAGAEKYCNNTGHFDIGGFDADSGCTGRKIVFDQYGPHIPVGGGAFSGKDPTKVDRSGAYMARWIALDLLKTKGLEKVLVQLAYVIGEPEPVSAQFFVHGRGYQLDTKEYDCRPEAIIYRFDLRRPIYLDTARNGHFGRDVLPWEYISI